MHRFLRVTNIIHLKLDNMKKFVLATTNTETLEIDMWGFETHEEAYSEMEEQYKEVVSGLEGFVTDNDIYEDSAYISSVDYDYVWNIKEL